MSLFSGFVSDGLSSIFGFCGVGLTSFILRGGFGSSFPSDLRLSDLALIVSSLDGLFLGFVGEYRCSSGSRSSERRPFLSSGDRVRLVDRALIVSSLDGLSLGSVGDYPRSLVLRSSGRRLFRSSDLRLGDDLRLSERALIVSSLDGE